jgi:hypothetical protein
MRIDKWKWVSNLEVTRHGNLKAATTLPFTHSVTYVIEGPTNKSFVNLSCFG